MQMSSQGGGLDVRSHTLGSPSLEGPPYPAHGLCILARKNEQWQVNVAHGAQVSKEAKTVKTRAGNWEPWSEMWAADGLKTDSIKYILGEYSVGRDLGKRTASAGKRVWSRRWPTGFYRWIWKPWFKGLPLGYFPSCFLVSWEVFGEAEWGKKGREDTDGDDSGLGSQSSPKTYTCM